ncbi:MAG TPA: PAS domain S-box protein [Caldisericia bacterium]|nr:PAS domain S-box protein [Caldisericia bacterium]HPF48359.1 PAS domain S-box protein [Caldisericia bacterium]HPI83462.1 PAS domain S-box protein [Caldisericia bacterium]HPQ92812.1 PAS domain S-box protein [Caldisericia bacterium]HRV74090.1 PAS domain S-box protein [Caldisericia bacterium]
MGSIRWKSQNSSEYEHRSVPRSIVGVMRVLVVSAFIVVLYFTVLPPSRYVEALVLDQSSIQTETTSAIDVELERLKDVNILLLAGCISLFMIITFSFVYGFLLRKRLIAASRELQLSERKRALSDQFKTFFNSSPISMAVSSLDTSVVIDVNDSFAAVTGYTREDAIGKTSDQLMLYVDPSQRDEMLRMVNSKDHYANMTIKIRRKDGTRIIGQLTASTAIMDDKEILLAAVTDVTKQKKLEEMLSKETQLLYVMSHAKDVSTDNKGFCSEVLRYLCDVFGFESGVVWKMDLSMDLHMISMVHVFDFQSDMMESQLDNLKNVALWSMKSSASVIEVGQSIVTSIDDVPQGALNLDSFETVVTWPLLGLSEKRIGALQLVSSKKIEDIIDNKQIFERLFSLFSSAIETNITDELLATNRKRYTKLFQTSNDAIIIHDLNGKVVEVNEKCQEVFEESESNFIGNNIKNYLVDTDLKMFEMNLGRMREAQFVNFEQRFKTSSGKTFIADISSSTVDLDGERYVQSILRDVTLTRNLLENLRTNEEKLSKIVNNATVGIILIDKSKMITEFNSQAESIFEVDAPDMFKVDFNSFSSKYFEKPAIFNNLIWSDQNELTSHESGFGVKHPFDIKTNGKNKKIEIEIVPIVLPEERMSLLIVNDVTEMWAARRELKRSEEQYKSLYESAPVGLFRTDINGWKISKINIFGSNVLGFENPDDVIGAEVDIRNHIQKRQFELLKDALDVNEFFKDMELSWRLDSGKVIYILASMQVNRKHGYIEGSLIDITERKYIEQAYINSEERFRNIINSTPMGIHMYELVGNDLILVGSNKAADRILGLSHEELQGRTIEQAFPGLVKITNPSTYKNVAIMGMNWHDEQVIYNGDEITGILDIYAFQASPMKMVVMFSDVTAKRKSEIERQKLQQEIEEKNKELSQIIYVTSHDLRSPLVNILGFTNELEEDIMELVKLAQSSSDIETFKADSEEIVGDKLLQSLEYIRKGGNKMDALLKGLLKISRIGRDTLVSRQVNMNELISDILMSMHYQISKYEINVESEDLEDCYGDKDELNQVFSNIIDNAIKFRDKNRSLVIRIRSKKHDDYVEYTIKDNGIGINKNHLPKVFEIFHRLHPKETTGQGLGMTIIQKIILRHGGTLWIDSEEGVGTQVHVSLPAAKNVTRGD